MVKLFCDRCGKESATLHKISVPVQKGISKGSFTTANKDVCDDCQKEYDNLIDKLLDVRFVMFKDFLKDGE